MASPPLPANVHVSAHPLLRANLSQLRSHSTNARETKVLVHEIATILGCEALATVLSVVATGTGKTPLGTEYTTESIEPSSIALVPILRSGPGMLEAIQTLLPSSVPVHHLGLFRDPTTLQPVEYYDNLPFHRPSSSSSASSLQPQLQPPPTTTPNPAAAHLAILLDPVIATGNTASAAIHLLREWGVARVVMLSVLGSASGVRRAAEEWWPDGVELWVGGVDDVDVHVDGLGLDGGQVGLGLDGRGMIVPGLGDIGDRLFMTGAAGK
ncbi:hypothetical protein VTN00DRAFT_3946 [Thermoascus crustaceus]|uniref:uncharacterized protein n=1 Tax=Thermoascus crustaceus TaxID=5088 RepID=UPI0037440793